MTTPCDRCPTFPMCSHKNGLDLVRECAYLEVFLTTRGRKTKKGQQSVIEIEQLKMRFMVTRNFEDHIHIGYIENETYWDSINEWYRSY